MSGSRVVCTAERDGFRCWLPMCCSVVEKVWFGSGFLKGEIGFRSRARTRHKHSSLFGFFFFLFFLQ